MPVGLINIGGGGSSAVVTALGEFTNETPLPLPLLPAVIDDLSEDIAPVGLSQASGLITFITGGLYDLFIERYYENIDQSPIGTVNITILIEADSGGGFETVYTNTAKIGAATNPSEPAYLSFGTRLLKQIVAGTVYRIKVNAIDGVVAAAGCSLNMIRFTATRYKS